MLPAPVEKRGQFKGEVIVSGGQGGIVGLTTAAGGVDGSVRHVCSERVESCSFGVGLG